MAVHKKTEKLFSLKDQLFNEVKVKQLAKEIKAAYPDFNTSAFVKTVVSGFPRQELMERIYGIRDALYTYLPKDYTKAVKIIVAALPLPLDPKKTDNDFGDFIYAPYSYYVCTYGCNKKDLKVSLKALEEITKRFSAEGAIRDFLNEYKDETLAVVKQWSQANNYHVRRLASEGTRPNLPWAKKINYDVKAILPILDTLHSDITRYVTRSVANHLNDISKFDPDLVIKTLKRWKKAKKQTKTELAFITKHALRTLVKEGHEEALALLGFASPSVKINTILQKKKLKVGETQKFNVTITSTSKEVQSLLIHYLIHFKKANGKLAPKTFFLGQKTLAPKETITISKSQAFKPMTTRTLHSGEHVLEIKINGQSFGKNSFELF